MKRIKPIDTAHSSLNPKLLSVLEGCGDFGVTIDFKLSDRLKERNLTERKVAEMTGLRLATISDLCMGKKGSVNLQHILFLMIYLRISDIRDLIDISIPKECVAQFASEKEQWIKDGEIPTIISRFAQCIKDKNCGECKLDALITLCKKVREKGNL